jgi:CheY-like chemotaxis protein
MFKILVVDDEPLVRKMLRQVLERAGYEVLEATNGKEGAKLFRETPADLIILDIIMPEQDGLQTIMKLRQDFRHVKVIGISGGGQSGPESYLEMASMLGAARTFAKPIDNDELLETVREILGGQTSEGAELQAP